MNFLKQWLAMSFFAMMVGLMVAVVLASAILVIMCLMCDFLAAQLAAIFVIGCIILGLVVTIKEYYYTVDDVEEQL